jgi:hypothetical protein
MVSRRIRPSIKTGKGWRFEPPALEYEELGAERWLFLGWAGGDDHALYAVVGLLRKNAAGGELVFGGIGATVNDALCVGVADTGKGLDLVRRSCVDVERSGGGGGGLSCLSNGVGRHSEGGNGSNQQGEGEKLVAKIQHE